MSDGSIEVQLDHRSQPSTSHESSHTPRPLDAVNVVDFSQVVLGPSCTQVLADWGADIIKVERPGVGDLERLAGPLGGHDNPVFASLNRSKRSIAIDLKNDEGRDIARDLIRSADVLVHNFRPGVLERLNLGFEDARRLNPRLIYAVGTGYGPTGPYAHKGGQDFLAQALTGIMARKADPTHPLAIFSTTLADYTASMHLAMGILLALLSREATGHGQRVDASLYDSLIAMQLQEATMLLMRDHELNWAAMPLDGVFETTDGAMVIVGAFKVSPLRDICVALNIDDLSRRDDFATLARMAQHRTELQAILQERFAQDTTANWIGRLEEQDILCAPVRTLGEALRDPQTEINGMILEIPQHDGDPIRTVASPIHLSETPIRVPTGPPSIGEHTDAILKELGYSVDRVKSLRGNGVVA